MYYYSLNEKLKKDFGAKAYKIALSGGFTCPNRDGTKGRGGCIFCLDGSGAFAQEKSKSIFEQIENAKSCVANKNKSGKYIAYFQSYTGTYASPEYLREIFTQAISHPDIIALSVATRPDCLEAEVLEVLADIAKIKPLWVELGLQTIHQKSIDYIRRGYQNLEYEKAVKNLHKIGAEVITHVILGLPNESKSEMLETVRYAAKNKTDGIKLQLLHVLYGTDLATDFEKGSFKALEMKEYTDILCECIETLPRNIVIHRLTGDGAKRDLIAPLWSADKKRVLNFVKSEFEKRNITQGKRYVEN